MNNKNFSKFISIFIFLITSTIVYGSDIKIPAGIYEYVYDYNTASMKENHYIKLSEKNNRITGQYFGTSDDFDEAREGYLPGFFSAEMKNIKVNNNEFSFTVKPDKFFNKPVIPMKKTVQNSLWDISIRSSKRNYSGRYQNGKLIIHSSGIDSRVFTKIK